MPSSHNGSDGITLRVLFQGMVAAGFRRKFKEALSVSGGTLDGVRRVAESRDLYEITVAPSRNCTSDGDPRLRRALTAMQSAPRSAWPYGTRSQRRSQDHSNSGLAPQQGWIQRRENRHRCQDSNFSSVAS